jgi:uncharacterized protein (DUF1697 family)
MGGRGEVTRLAVMLRAVNVGGRRLTMADFKAALAAEGLEDAVTVAATGNAVAAAKPSPDLEARLETGLGRALGGPLEVFVRDAAALARVVAENPFPQLARDDPSHLLVMFLRDTPTKAAVAALQAKIVGRETVAAGPGCLYSCFPDGIGRSKLTSAVVERALKLRGTGRNWNTVRKLADLTAQEQPSRSRA